MKDEKKIKIHYTVDQQHWVGDGFHVRGIIRPTRDLIDHISPFILMDYATPKIFKPTDKKLGVGEHPHRGFETVTFAYQGEVEHRDSSGGGGVIEQGEVQWMTAGSGIVHEEFHSRKFAKKGGVFEMVQLWVNLPKTHKMTQPKYQAIKKDSIPRVVINENLELRVIAGSYEENTGPASTFTNINIYDLSSKKESQAVINLPAETNTIILVMSGHAIISENNISEHSVAIFERSGSQISLKASRDFKALILNGEPINEPVVAHGPFVMNTIEEIKEAFSDYSNGKMGNLKS